MAFVGTPDMVTQSEHQRGRPWLYQTSSTMFVVITEDDALAEEAISQLPCCWSNEEMPERPATRAGRWSSMVHEADDIAVDRPGRRQPPGRSVPENTCQARRLLATRLMIM
jgi:hypothetical protein